MEQKFIESIRDSQAKFIDQFGMALFDKKHNILIKDIFDSQ